MIQRDYLLKQLHQFLDELKQRLHTVKKSDIQDIDVQLNDLYKDFFNQSRAYFLRLSVDEIVYEVGSIDNIALLAELFFCDAQLTTEDDSRKLLEKSKQLFTEVAKRSKTYSFERAQRMNEINKMLRK